MSGPSRSAGSEVARFMRFCGVGALGFAVDAGVLLWLTGMLDLNPFLARVLSILTALTATWLLHRHWTFAAQRSRRFAQWSRFVLVNGGGGGVNYLVYSAVLLALPGTAPVAALAAGSAVALLINYLGSRLWVFRCRQRDAVSDSPEELTSPGRV